MASTNPFDFLNDLVPPAMTAEYQQESLKLAYAAISKIDSQMATYVRDLSERYVIEPDEIVSITEHMASLAKQRRAYVKLVMKRLYGSTK